MLLITLIFIVLATVSLPTDGDKLAQMIALVIAGLGLMTSGAAIIMAKLADWRAKRAESSGKAADAELAGGEGEPTARQLLVENFRESVEARKAAVAANISAQRAEGMCGELQQAIATQAGISRGEFTRLEGRITEVAQTARNADARATEALQVVRAIEHAKRRATDEAVVDAATGGDGADPVPA